MFAGLRVLEFGQYVAAPVAAMLLADLGADVIKVERPGGDPLRTLRYQTWNRGKRIVELDLASDAGRRHALRLAEGADVVIDGLKPGAMTRFGISLRRLGDQQPC